MGHTGVSMEDLGSDSLVRRGESSFNSGSSGCVAKTLIERLKVALETEAKETLSTLEVESRAHLCREREQLQAERLRLEELAYKLEQERLQLARERESVQRRAVQAQRSMGGCAQSMVTPTTNGSSEIIELNVGGAPVTIKRSTLCQVPGSALHAMFSGQGEGVERDGQGRLFLDVQPECFHAVLTALRHLAIAAPHTAAALGPLRADLEPYLESLLDYLGLSGLVFSDDPESYLGKRVEVYWSRYRKYYPGTVTAYDAETGKHEVRYDDGDVRCYDLSHQDWRWEQKCVHWRRGGKTDHPN